MLPRNGLGHAMTKGGLREGGRAYFLIDSSGSMPRELVALIRAIPYEIGWKDWSLHVVNFDTRPMKTWDVSAKVGDGLSDYHLTNGGGTHLASVFRHVRSHGVLRAREGRHLVFVLTDGMFSEAAPDSNMFDVVWLRVSGLQMFQSPAMAFGRFVAVEHDPKTFSRVARVLSENEVHVPINKAISTKGRMLDEWLTEEVGRRRVHPIFEAKDGINNRWDGDWARRYADPGEPDGLYYWFKDPTRAVHFALRWQGEFTD